MSRETVVILTFLSNKFQNYLALTHDIYKTTICYHNIAKQFHLSTFAHFYVCFDLFSYKFIDIF